MSAINRPPQGLQQLLGSQNFGDNPKQLGQVVNPTLDMLPFYGSGILRLRRSSSSNAGEGEITSITFEDQIALISVAGWCEAGVNANGTYALGLTLSGPPSNNLPVNQQHVLAVSPSILATTPTTSQPATAYTFPSPLVVEPGTTVHVHWFYNTANSGSIVQLTALFYDLSEG